MQQGHLASVYLLLLVMIHPHLHGEDVINAIIALISSVPVTFAYIVSSSLSEIFLGFLFSMFLFILGKTMDFFVRIYLQNREFKRQDDKEKSLGSGKDKTI